MLNMGVDGVISDYPGAGSTSSSARRRGSGTRRRPRATTPGPAAPASSNRRQPSEPRQQRRAQDVAGPERHQHADVAGVDLDDLDQVRRPPRPTPATKPADDVVADAHSTSSGTEIRARSTLPRSPPARNSATASNSTPPGRARWSPPTSPWRRVAGGQLGRRPGQRPRADGAQGLGPQPVERLRISGPGTEPALVEGEGSGCSHGWARTTPMPRPAARSAVVSTTGATTAIGSPDAVTATTPPQQRQRGPEGSRPRPAPSLRPVAPRLHAEPRRPGRRGRAARRRAGAAEVPVEEPHRRASTPAAPAPATTAG